MIAFAWDFGKNKVLVSFILSQGRMGRQDQLFFSYKYTTFYI
jgi:hypothetical protein